MQDTGTERKGIDDLGSMGPSFTRDQAAEIDSMLDNLDDLLEPLELTAEEAKFEEQLTFVEKLLGAEPYVYTLITEEAAEAAFIWLRNLAICVGIDPGEARRAMVVLFMLFQFGDGELAWKDSNQPVA